MHQRPGDGLRGIRNSDAPLLPGRGILLFEVTARDVPIRIEELLAHRQWVAGLAAALTRDQSEADDVVQQTWLAALRRPPRGGGSVRGWLGTVVRNTVRERGRSGARRARREEAAARPHAVTSDDPAELTARAELHATVSAAVVALDEPYRRAILLRHFEGLPVAEVARRLDTPLETTRARLRRGRARLRERLERDLGDGRPLAILLLPLTRNHATAAALPTTSAVAIGGALMTAKTMAATTVAVALLLLALWWGGGFEEELTHGASPVADTMESMGGSDRALETTGMSAGHAARARSRVEAGGALTDTPESPGARGAKDTLDPSIAGPADDDTENENTESKKSTRSAGAGARIDSVIDEILLESAPLEDVIARISWYTKAPIDLDLAVVGDVRDQTTSINAQGSAGRDVLGFCAAVAALEMRVEDDRVVLHRAGMEWRDDLPVMRVEPLPPEGVGETVRLSGRVLDAGGRPVPGAAVSGFPQPVRTDEEGRFDVFLPPRSIRVQARRDGFAPSPSLLLESPIDAEESVDLVLGPAAAEIRVQVTGADASPLGSVDVRAIHTDGSAEMQRTAADGRVHFRQSPPGEVVVVAVAEGHGRVARTVATAAGVPTDVTFELPRRTFAERLRHERTTFVIEDEPLTQVALGLWPRWDVAVRLGAGVPHAIAARTIALRISDDTLEGALRAICDAAGTSYRVDEERQIVWIEVK